MIKVYDQAGTMLAALEYADAVGYNLPHNDLWTATFRLPKDDPKNAYCQMHNLVSIDDGPRNLGMYRIIGSPDADMTTPGSYIVYNCEHVVATLLDDVLFGYHEVGGVSMDTAAVIRYILAQQDTARWQLGTCDFNQNFSYKFENDTLLGAIMSLGNVLTEPYTWDFDTDTTPWTINLRKADTAASCGIYYKRNLQQITKAVDASTLVTRLYLLGYGEGVNQLTIRDINGGKPYIDADTISVYGVKKSVFVDRRFEDPTALKARGEALLEGLKIPYTTYTAKAADLAQLTGDAWDTFMPGKIVHVLDGEDGIQFEARIVNVSKPDVHGRRGDVDIIIANSPRDIADSINTLADRQGINDLYSQGATNLYAQQFADNADADHPAVMRVFVPTGCVRINQMLVSYTAVNFRAYEKGAAAGGGSERTSSAGGSQVVTTSVMTLASATACSTPVTSDGSVTAMTSANEDQTTGTSSLLATDSSSGALVTGEGGEHTHTGPSHRHTGPSHTHAFSGSDSVANGHTHSIPSPGTSTNTGGVSTNVTHDVRISGNTDSAGTGNTGYGGTGNTGSAGKHNHSMAPHTHGMTHTHSVAGHSHKFSHVHLIQAAIEIPEQSINIPSHSHSVTIDPHTHAMEYGIFEGGKAGSITVKVDGVAVDGVSETSATELDIAAYLEKDDEGKIRRGCWHTVELVPDTLTRIEANLFVQAFVQSVGGGDY